MPSPAPALIAIDWGTSNLRVSLLGTEGTVLATRVSAEGVMSVPAGSFAAVLLKCCGDWIDAHGCPLIASGMVGSRQGWAEVPYLDAPAAPGQAAARLHPVSVRPGVSLHIVPGLHTVAPDGRHDVMRGEETQLWGAGLAPGRCCLLPGTHSKWAWTGEAETIVRFETAMTGELFALLKQHSILGRLMPAPAPARAPAALAGAAAEAFDQGVRLGLAPGGRLLQSLFTVRTAGLMQTLPAEGLSDLLSGLLIGAELAGALGAGAAPTAPVLLLGEANLCERYARALALAGVASEPVPAGATERGLWRLAQAAGLLAGGRGR